MITPLIKKSLVRKSPVVNGLLVKGGSSGGGGTIETEYGTNSITFNAKANGLKALTLFGGIEQSGTPTPTTPQDIVSNNGALKYSNNLLDMATENIVLGKYINNSGVVSDSGPNFYNSKYIPVVAGETYTWSTSSSISYFSVMEYDSSYVFKKRTLFSNAGTSGSITLRSDAAFVLIGSNMDSADITLDKIAAVDWQFEKGSSATAYKPYSPTGIYTDGTVETVEVTGRNLFDIATQTISQGAISSSKGANSNSNSRVRTDYLAVQPNTEYTVSADITGYTSGTGCGVFVFEYIASQGDYVENFVSGSGSGWKSPDGYTFTTGATTKAIRIVLAADTTKAISPSDINWVQLEHGDTATTYEPYYNGGSATAEMLLKVGDYKDEQNVTNGHITRNVGVMVFDGSENWVSAGTGSSSRCHIAYDIGLPNTEDLTSPMICSHYQFGGYFSAGGSTTEGTFNAFSRRKEGNEAYYLRFSIVGMGISSASGFKQWLADQYAAGTPVIIIYPLATPTTETVTPQTLQTQAGTNTISITQASLSSLDLEAKYKKGN